MIKTVFVLKIKNFEFLLLNSFLKFLLFAEES